MNGFSLQYDGVNQLSILTNLAFLKNHRVKMQNTEQICKNVIFILTCSILTEILETNIGVFAMALHIKDRSCPSLD